MLAADEARTLLVSIDTDTLIGLRDPGAPIGLIVHTFACAGAAIEMKVEEYYIRGGAAGYGCMRKRQASRPAVHPDRDNDLKAYIEAVDDAKGTLCQTAAARSDRTSRSGSRTPTA